MNLYESVKNNLDTTYELPLNGHIRNIGVEGYEHDGDAWNALINKFTNLEFIDTGKESAYWGQKLLVKGSKDDLYTFVDYIIENEPSCIMSTLTPNLKKKIRPVSSEVKESGLDDMMNSIEENADIDVYDLIQEKLGLDKNKVKMLFDLMNKNDMFEDFYEAMYWNGLIDSLKSMN